MTDQLRKEAMDRSAHECGRIAAVIQLQNGAAIINGSPVCGFSVGGDIPSDHDAEGEVYDTLGSAIDAIQDLMPTVESALAAPMAEFAEWKEAEKRRRERRLHSIFTSLDVLHTGAKKR